jgi:hypothetical protein
MSGSTSQIKVIGHKRLGITAGPGFGKIFRQAPQKFRAIPSLLKHRLSIPPPGNDIIFVTDQCNHRVSIYDTAGNYFASFGQRGTKNGEFRFPIGISLDF